MTLHILNGQAMYDYFNKISFLENEAKVPFNEAMCVGETTMDPFSDEYIAIRSKAHGVTEEQYKEITMKPLQQLINKEFTDVSLWFDEDMFCQINIFTILAWLDDNNFPRPIDLHIVGDKFELIEKYTLNAKGYKQLYKEILIDKTMPEFIEIQPLKRGAELYLSYLDQNSDLMLYINQHKDTPEKELMHALLENFSHYGLGDIQYIDLIRKNRK